MDDEGATVRRVSASRDGVGESPVWSVSEARLYRVDITGRAVVRLDPATGEEERWTFPEIVTSVGLARDGGLVVGLRKTIARYEPGGQPRPFAEIEPDLPRNRLNEGAVAPDGSFWVGTMRDNIGPHGEEIEIDAWTGALHRVAPDGSVEQLTPNETGIANTMVWSGSCFVTADTLADTLHAYAMDANDRLSGRAKLASGSGPGLPDGSAIDDKGFIWNARFGGACLVRLAPDGTVDRTVSLPCTNPTSCAFGGDEYRTLFVTSARFGLSDEALAAEPRNGAVFALDVGAAGTAPHQFGQPRP